MCVLILIESVKERNIAPKQTSKLAADSSKFIVSIPQFCRWGMTPLSYKNKVYIGISSKPSTCILDQIPTRLFKEVFPLIDTSILDLINLSLLTGHVPQTFKIAVIKPLLQKPTFDSEV